MAFNGVHWGIMSLININAPQWHYKLQPGNGRESAIHCNLDAFRSCTAQNHDDFMQWRHTAEEYVMAFKGKGEKVDDRRPPCD